MAVFSSIIGALSISASTAATIGGAASLIGTGLSVAGSFQQAAGQRKAQNAQKRQEAYRQKQMENDSRRTQMELIRQQQIARATALTNVTASGASAPDSSAMGGAEGTISGTFGRGIQADQSNLAFGQLQFAENRRIADANKMAARGGTIASAGAGLSSLGGIFINNAERIDRVGQTNRLGRR